MACPLIRPTAISSSILAQAIGPACIASAQPSASVRAPSKLQCSRELPRTAPNTSACPVANKIAAQTQRSASPVVFIQRFLSSLQLWLTRLCEFVSRFAQLSRYLLTTIGQPQIGQVSDIEIQASEILKDRRRLNEILARHTGMSAEVIEKETERDRYFSAQEAIRPASLPASELR